MMKILHISSNSYPNLNIDHSTRRIWEELSKGFDEYHILARSSDNRYHTSSLNNIHLHLVPKLGSSKSFFLTSWIMMVIIKKYKIDLILSQCPLFGGVTAIIASKFYRIPVMIEMHGQIYFNIMKSMRKRDKVISKLIKFSLSRATKVRALSRKMEIELKNYVNNVNVVIIPNRVNLRIYKDPKASYQIFESVKIISVGRFVWEKNYELAIKSIIQIKEKYNVHLTLIGGGPLLKKLEQISSGHDDITLIENLPQKSIVPLLRNADIYIQPSISEGMPRTILEAMAIGLPIIASNIGSIPDVLKHNYNGLLIEPNDLEQLVIFLEYLIENEVIREKLGTNGLKTVLNSHEWNKVFELYKNELINMKYILS